MKKYSHLLILMILIFIFTNFACDNTVKVEMVNPTSTPILVTTPTVNPTQEPTPTGNPPEQITPIVTVNPTITPTATMIPTVTPTPTMIPTPTPVPDQRVKIMIMARQHGNEPAPTSAIFSYISNLVNNPAKYLFNDDSTILNSSEVYAEIAKIESLNLSDLDIEVEIIGLSYDSKPIHRIKIQRPSGQSFDNDNILPSGVTLLFIPMVNPDGSDLNIRDNHDISIKDDDSTWGVNINRHWDDLRELENHAVHDNVFDVFQPEIVLDLHEFTPATAFKKSFHMTYCPGTRNETPEQTPQSLKDLYPPFETMVNSNLTAGGINYNITHEARLAVNWTEGDSRYGGNHFCIKHYAINYTIETQGIVYTGWTLPLLADRANMQKIFFKTMIKYAAINKDQIIGIVSSLRGD